MAELQSYTITEFKGGVSNNTDRGVRGSFKRGRNIDCRGEHSGLQANPKLQEINATNDLVLFGVPTESGDWYGFGETGKIYRRTPGGSLSQKHDEDENILGAAEYTHKDSNNNYVPHLVWATRTHLKEIKTSNASGFRSGDIVTIGTFRRGLANQWHTMKEALGRLMICDSNYIAVLDYEGAFNNSALDFLRGLRTRVIEEQDNLVIIGAQEAEQSKRGFLFTWNGRADSWITKKQTGAKGVHGLNIMDTGTLVQTGNNLAYWDTVNWVPLKKLPGGGTVLPGAQETDDGISLFGVNDNTEGDNGIWGYGKRDGESVRALNLEYASEDLMLNDTKIGSISYHGDKLLVSYQGHVGNNLTNYKIAHIITDYATLIWESLETDADLPFMDKAWKQIKIVNERLGSSDYIEVWTKASTDTDWKQAIIDDDTDGQTTRYTGSGKTSQVFLIANGTGQGERIEVRVLSRTGASSSKPVNIKSVSLYYLPITIY